MTPGIARRKQVQNCARYAHLAADSIKDAADQVASTIAAALNQETLGLKCCVTRVERAYPNASLPGGSLGLTWAGLAPADRASFAWRLPLFDHLVGDCEKRRRNFQAERIGGPQI
jgi:hypothetical protein